jgi:hypothetical protein
VTPPARAVIDRAPSPLARSIPGHRLTIELAPRAAMAETGAEAETSPEALFAAAVRVAAAAAAAAVPGAGAGAILANEAGAAAAATLAARAPALP